MGCAACTGYGHVAEILFTFGLAYLIAEVVVMLWGRNPIENKVPAVIDFPAFVLFGTRYPFYKVLMMAISVGMFAFLYLAFKRTRIGLIIQASLTHPRMVGALGHDVPRIFVLVFAVGSALAGLAGVIGGFALLTEPNMAAALGPIVFVVVVVGGLGSIPGALIASMLIGIVQTFAVAMDYSLLDLFRVLGVAVSPGRRARRRLLGAHRAGRAAHPVPAAGADAHPASARAARHPRELSMQDSGRARHAWRISLPRRVPDVPPLPATCFASSRRGSSPSPSCSFFRTCPGSPAIPRARC